MTISQRVTWTLLPNGVKDASTLRASIYVSPRLSISAADVAAGEQADLSHFTDWLEWPQRISGASFEVRSGGKAVAATRVSPDPDAAVWSALFPPSTRVEPYDFAGSDFSGKTVLSYPVATVHKNVRSIYGRLATATSEMPTPRQAAFLAEQSRQYSEMVDAVLGKSGNPFDQIRPQPSTPTILAPPPIDRTNLFTALDLLTLFHRPLNKEIAGTYTKKSGVTPPDIRESVKWRSYELAAMPTATELSSKIDFHRIVAALAQYPALLRTAGLVIDLEFARPADGEFIIQALIDWHPDNKVQTEEDLRPRLRTVLQGDSFYAAPRDPGKTALTDRFLRLRKAGAEFFPHPVYFDLFEMDVDGAGIKLKNLLLGWEQASRAVSYDDETDASVQPARVSAPSLRSGGLMLANSNRDVEVSDLFQRNKKLDSLSAQQINSGSGVLGSDPGLMSAEDVVRGYRADIHDASRKRWFPLHMRDGTFILPNTGKKLNQPGEEGMTRLAAATSTDGENADIVKVHEAMFTWRGWSLAAPEPGNSLLARIDPASDTTNPANVVGDGQADVPAGMPLKADFKITPGTLPSLRFGRTYMARVRVTDLAGNSAPFSAGDAQPADAVSAPVMYRRYEPVESPALALVRGTGGLEKPGEGESMARAAIRTFNDVPAKNTVPIPGRARRHIVPPRVSHRFAEVHGVLDGPDGKPDPKIYTLLATRDSPLEEETWKSRDGKTTLTYAAADEKFTLPYLPDPWALGVAFKVDGLQPAIDPEKLYFVPFYDTGFAYSKTNRPDWPNARPFTVVILEEGPAEPTFNATTREFRIAMHKGERARVRVSSILPTPKIFSMAMAAVIEEQNLSQAEKNLIGVEIAKGQHWMFTPWRVIELVHAVQKPLITPEVLTPVTINRKLGSVHAEPIIPLALHSKSTAKIDVNATWIEPNDDPAALVPLPSGYAGNKPRYPDPAGQTDLTPADPGITNHRTRAFELNIARLASVNDTFVVGAPPSPNSSFSYPPQHVFGDTHYRRITYQIDATSRFREFMPAAIQKDPKKLTVSSSGKNPKAVAWIPNSAAPPTPKLLYVIPTFGWGHGAKGNQSRSFRSGGGLRVYLDRPWYATGFTEMLAVVLPPGPVFHQFAPYGDAQALPPYITQWGADPIWADGRVQTVAPQPDAFPLARWRPPIPFEGVDAFPAEEGTNLPDGDFLVTGLRVPEMLQTADVDPATPGELAIAPHAVSYDAERQLWYADIVIRPSDAYLPFIRLALARYNPISVPGAHLSSVVMTEFVQLTPDRLAIVTQNNDKAHVAMYGIGTQQPLGEGARSGLFEIHTETLAPGADPDLGWQHSSAGGTSGLAGEISAFRPMHIMEALGDVSKPAANAGEAAQQLLAKGDYAGFMKRPDLLAAAAPPFLWQGAADLPVVAEGTRVRLVITESEVFQTGEHGESPALSGSRVVYLETVELSPVHHIQAAPPVPIKPVQPQPELPLPSNVPVPTPRPEEPPTPIAPAPRPLPGLRPSNPPATIAPEPRPAPGLRPVNPPNFSGDWDVLGGRGARFRWQLTQSGNTVTGTILPGNGTVRGKVNKHGRLNFSWVERAGGRGLKLSGRGYADLTSPDSWEARWWLGNSRRDPTPNQPNTWHGRRAAQPREQSLPALKVPLFRRRKR